MIERIIALLKPRRRSSNTWPLATIGVKQQVYHGSFDVGDPAPVFKVRTPNPERCTHGEDTKTPRISCATNLLDVIATGYIWSPRNQDVLPVELRTQLNVYGLSVNSVVIPSLVQVPDAGMTGEVWVVNDKDLQQELCAVVKVTNHCTLQDLLGTEHSGWNYLMIDLEIEVLTQLQYDRKKLLTPGKYAVSIMRMIDSDAPCASEVNEPAITLCDFITQPPYVQRVFDMVDTIVEVLLEDLMVRADNGPVAVGINFLVDLNRFTTVALSLVLRDKEKIKGVLLLEDFKEFVREVTRNMTLCDWHTTVLNRRTYYVLTATGVNDTENKEIPKWELKKGLFQTK